MSHTPGPWGTSPDGVPEAFRPQITVYAESDGHRVATVFRDEANARLIAAAPDLLAALHLASDYLTDRQCIELGVYAALAKAEGTTQ